MAIFRTSVELSWPGPGSPGANTFHLRTTEASGTPGNGLVIDDAIPVLQAFIEGVYGFVGVNALAWSGGKEWIDVDTQEIIEKAGFDGSEADGGMPWAPTATAICIGWRTTLAARRGRGRTFVGPVKAETVDSDGRILAGTRTGLETTAAAFVTASNAIAGGSFAIYGQQAAGIASEKVARDIVGSKIGPDFAVLRSRRD